MRKNRDILHTPDFLKKIGEMHIKGDGYQRISTKIKDEMGISVTGTTIATLLRNEAYKIQSVVASNDEMKFEAEKSLKKSLKRIEDSSELVWNAIQKFKDPQDITEVNALTTLIRSIKDDFEIHLKYIGGDKTVQVGTMNVMYNDIELAGKIAKIMDENCKNCRYKIQAHIKPKEQYTDVIETTAVNESEINVENAKEEVTE